VLATLQWALPAQAVQHMLHFMKVFDTRWSKEEAHNCNMHMAVMVLHPHAAAGPGCHHDEQYGLLSCQWSFQCSRRTG